MTQNDEFDRVLKAINNQFNDVDLPIITLMVEEYDLDERDDYELGQLYDILLFSKMKNNK